MVATIIVVARFKQLILLNPYNSIRKQNKHSHTTCNNKTYIYIKTLIGNGEQQGGGGGYSKPGRSLKRSEMNDIDSRSENGSNGKWNFPAFVPPE